MAGSRGLSALTPKFDEKHHRVYVDAINAGLADPQVRNIALSGGYGVGKSSILEEVAAENVGKVVSISLSTLGFDPAQNQKERNERTELIQREIVKQLLYQLAPHRFKGSRFRRLGTFQPGPALGMAAAIALLLTGLSLVVGWTPNFAQVFDSLLAPSALTIGPWIHLIVFVVFTAMAFALLAAFHNRVQIPRVKAADLEIEVGSSDAGYFDKYLDEIVFFFESTKKSLVIFEDIDRFNNPGIFETLRALNTLLNSTEQIKEKPIRFIYAMRDSIFIEIGKEATATEGDLTPEDRDAQERANRTKFFELVVPVVPFITHSNARNLIDQELGDELRKEIDSGLIDLAARHITDMRLIRSLRNEYDIFASKVLVSDEGKPMLLSPSGLFAMMLYKAVHLDDFEKIKSGTSQLDEVYEAYRKVFVNTRDRLAVEIQSCERDLTDLAAVDRNAKRAGDALEDYARRLRRQMEVGEAAEIAYNYGGKKRTADIRSTSLWKDIAGSDNSLQLVISGRQPMSLFKQDLVDLVGPSLASVEAWEAANKSDLEGRIARLREARDEVVQGDMDVLLTNDDYVDADGNHLSEATKKLGSKLARELVGSGFLGKDFVLYTSTYYGGRVSTEAQNYIIRNVDRELPDTRFALTAEDVEAIVRERGTRALRTPGMYNIAVLNHLLAPATDEESDEHKKSRDQWAGMLVSALASDGINERQIMEAYLADGEYPNVLVERLTGRWSGVFSLLGRVTDLPVEKRVAMLNSALSSLTPRRSYAVRDNGFRDMIEDHTSLIPVLLSPDTPSELATRIASHFATAGVQVKDLGVLGPEVRTATINASAFEISRMNLEAVTGGSGIALDEVRTSSKLAYDYLIENLEEYLDVIHGGESKTPAVASARAIPEVLADAAPVAPDLVGRILDAVVQPFQVEELSTVPQQAWPALAERSMFPATFENVTTYIDTVGAVDEQIAKLLDSTAGIKTIDESSAADKLKLVKTLLAAGKLLPSPQKRVELVHSLGIEGNLSLSDVPTESGPLLGLLIENGLVADIPASIAHAKDWKTREFAIRSAPDFLTYMTPAEVSPADVPNLLKSSTIPKAVKDAVLERADEFAPGADKPSLSALAEYALTLKETPRLPKALVIRMAESRVNADSIVRLLHPILEELSEAELVAVLVTLGGVYADISARNKKWGKKVPRTPAHLALLSRLHGLGIVSKYPENGDHYNVSMYKKP